MKIVGPVPKFPLVYVVLEAQGLPLGLVWSQIYPCYGGTIDQPILRGVLLSYRVSLHETTYTRFGLPTFLSSYEVRIPREVQKEN